MDTKNSGLSKQGKLVGNRSEIQKEIGFKGEVKGFGMDFGENEDGQATEYNPIVDGETLIREDSSYGMGYFKNQRGDRWFFGSCNVANTPYLFEMEKPSDVDLQEFREGGTSLHEMLLILLSDERRNEEIKERGTLK